MNKNFKETITNKVIEMLEQGEIPWVSPFEHQIFPMNYLTKREYNGVNLISLWLEAKAKGYTANYWMGFKQASSLGGKVKKGERGTPITVCCPHKKKVTNNRTGEEEEKTFGYFKTDYVFNVYSQIEGIDFEEQEHTYRPLEDFELLVNNYGLNIQHSGERAFYSVGKDYINMPFKSKFKTQEAYYSTLAHELIHSTMSEERCDRKELDNKQDRALEELIAEIGAAFLCAEFGVKSDLQNTTAYIQSWIRALNNDTNFIFKASKLANDAVNYLMAFNKEVKLSA